MKTTKRSTNSKMVELCSFQLSKLLYFDFNPDYIAVVTRSVGGYRAQIHRDIPNRQLLLQKNAMQFKTTHILKITSEENYFFTSLFFILQGLPYVD